MIHIDRVRMNVDVAGARKPEPDAMPAASTTFDRAAREQLRAIVLEVFRDHLRDLERRGMA